MSRGGSPCDAELCGRASLDGRESQGGWALLVDGVGREKVDMAGLLETKAIGSGLIGNGLVGCDMRCVVWCVI